METTTSKVMESLETRLEAVKICRVKLIKMKTITFIVMDNLKTMLEEIKACVVKLIKKGLHTNQRVLLLKYISTVFGSLKSHMHA